MPYVPPKYPMKSHLRLGISTQRQFGIRASEAEGAMKSSSYPFLAVVCVLAAVIACKCSIQPGPSPLPACRSVVASHQREKNRRGIEVLRVCREDAGGEGPSGDESGSCFQITWLCVMPLLLLLVPPLSLV